MKPYIYRRKIIATKKYYVGKHNGNNSKYKGSGIEYKKDLQQYKETELEILEYVDDISKLNEREVYWLKKLDVVNNPLYYNKTNKSYGVCKTSKETKQKQSKSSPKRKQIIQYDLKGNFIKVWECMNDASKELNIDTGDLTCCCQKKQKSAGKFQWMYYQDNYPLKITPYNIYSKPEFWRQEQSKRMKGKRSKPILQYDKQGNFVKEWNSILEAKKQYKGDIQRCCTGKSKTSCGFIWKYKI